MDEKTVPFCINCKHYRKVAVAGHGCARGLEGKPLPRDPVLGTEMKAAYPGCYDERRGPRHREQKSSYCGPSGQFFEPKEEPTA